VCMCVCVYTVHASGARSTEIMGTMHRTHIRTYAHTHRNRLPRSCTGRREIDVSVYLSLTLSHFLSLTHTHTKREIDRERALSLWAELGTKQAKPKHSSWVHFISSGVQFIVY